MYTAIPGLSSSKKTAVTFKSPSRTTVIPSSVSVEPAQWEKLYPGFEMAVISMGMSLKYSPVHGFSGMIRPETDTVPPFDGTAETFKFEDS